MSIYAEALELANYEIEEGVSMESQFRDMFLECVDCGMYRDITDEEEANYFIEEIGLEKIAKIMVRKMKTYNKLYGRN